MTFSIGQRVAILSSRAVQFGRVESISDTSWGCIYFICPDGQSYVFRAEASELEDEQTFLKNRERSEIEMAEELEELMNSVCGRYYDTRTDIGSDNGHWLVYRRGGGIQFTYVYEGGKEFDLENNNSYYTVEQIKENPYEIRPIVAAYKEFAEREYIKFVPDNLNELGALRDAVYDWLRG